MNIFEVGRIILPVIPTSPEQWPIPLFLSYLPVYLPLDISHPRIGGKEAEVNVRTARSPFQS